MLHSLHPISSVLHQARKIRMLPDPRPANRLHWRNRRAHQPARIDGDLPRAVTQIFLALRNYVALRSHEPGAENKRKGEGEREREGGTEGGAEGRGGREGASPPVRPTAPRRLRPHHPPPMQ